MHSRAMSRLGGMCQTANVGIGSKFRAEEINAKETRKKIDACLQKHGVKTVSRFTKGREHALRLWRKIKAGKMNPETIPLLERDHGHFFKEFENGQLL